MRAAIAVNGSIFTPNPKKLLPKDVEKSCQRRLWFTGRAGGDDVHWGRGRLNSDILEARLVKAANATRYYSGTNSGGHHHQYGRMLEGH